MKLEFKEAQGCYNEFADVLQMEHLQFLIGEKYDFFDTISGLVGCVTSYII